MIDKIKKINKDVLLGIVLIAVVIMSITIPKVFAYFIGKQSTEGTVSIGYNEIKINEKFENPDIEPLKNTTITKQIKVENIGANPCAIRVKVAFSNEEILKYTDIDYDTNNWTYNADEKYWYYNKVLDVNNGDNSLKSNYESTALFTKLVLNKPTEEQIRDFDVYIYAESRNCKLTDKAIEIWEKEAR